MKIGIIQQSNSPLIEDNLARLATKIEALAAKGAEPVSYTHLTLPTILLV